MPQVQPQQQRPARSRKAAWITTLVTWTMALVVPAGIGYALWSTTGTGSGQSSARTAAALEVTAGSATAQLYPGASGNIVFSVTNPNPYTVSVTSWTAATITGTSDPTNCPASNFQLNTGSITATTVTGANGTANVTVTNGITMKTTAPDGCQGVTVTVNATLSGTQA